MTKNKQKTQFKVSVQKKFSSDPIKYTSNFFKLLQKQTGRKSKNDLWMDFIEKHPNQVSSYEKKCKRIEDIRRKS